MSSLMSAVLPIRRRNQLDLVPALGLREFVTDGPEAVMRWLCSTGLLVEELTVVLLAEDRLKRHGSMRPGELVAERGHAHQHHQFLRPDARDACLITPMADSSLLDLTGTATLAIRSGEMSSVLSVPIVA